MKVSSHLRGMSIARFNWAGLALLPVVLIVLWDLAIRLFKIPAFLMPTPMEVWESIVQNRLALFAHGQVTLAETLLGFGLSIAIGMPLAVMIVASSLLDRLLFPVLVASQAVPKVALAPMLLVTLGYGATPKIIVALLVAFFPIVVNTVAGLRSVNRDTLKLMRSMGATPFQVFIKVRFPSAVPSILAGFRVAIALAVIGAVVGEFVGSRTGLGYLMLSATGNFDTALVFACMITLTVMGIVLFYSISLIDAPLKRFNRLAIAQRSEENATP
jgi:NitT/TauT family transport system permease protein